MADEQAIARKTYSDTQAKELLLDALRGRKGRLTLADAITASGLPAAHAEQALTSLLREYRSHVAATDKGELIYEFDPSFERRDAVPFREKLSRAGRALWRGFTFTFKIAIVATLIGYFVLFVAMMLAMIFARRGEDRDRDGGFDIGWPLFWIWGWSPHGYAHRHPRLRRKPQKPLYKKVFDFVFGPPKPQLDPLADEKDILAYIRRNDGRISAADLVGLMGWDMAKAEEEATRLMADYGGEPEVTDDGVVLYVFRDLRKTALAEVAPDERRPVRRAWERMETAPPLTGNGAGTNTAIGFFNGFNLLAPFWIVPAFEARLLTSLEPYSILLRDFPVAFSTIFFAVPLGRWIVERGREGRRQERNRRRELLRQVYAVEGAPLPPERLAPEPALEATLTRALVPLGGDVDPGEDGKMRYVFPRIQQELQAVARARRQATGKERDAGEVVFSSRD